MEQLHLLSKKSALLREGFVGAGKVWGDLLLEIGFSRAPLMFAVTTITYKWRSPPLKMSFQGQFFATVAHSLCRNGLHFDLLLERKKSGHYFISFLWQWLLLVCFLARVSFNLAPSEGKVSLGSQFHYTITKTGNLTTELDEYYGDGSPLSSYEAFTLIYL